MDDPEINAPSPSPETSSATLSDASPEGGPESSAADNQTAHSSPPTAAAARSKFKSERLPGVHLKLQLGNTLFLRLLCVGQRYETKVVGFNPYEYLIVQTRLPQDTLTKLQHDPGGIAQVDAGGTLFGFRTEVLNRVSNPAPLLFLSYPDTVERVILRRGERVQVTIPAHIHGAFGDHEVIIVDLTANGCRLSARSNLNSPLRAAQPGERIVLECELTATCGTPFIAPFHLRKIEEEKGYVTMGGEFVDLTEENAITLADYVERLRKLAGG